MKGENSLIYTYLLSLNREKRFALTIVRNTRSENN